MTHTRESELDLLFLRLKAGVKQYELADHLGVYPEQLSRFEKRGVKLPRGLTRDDYLKALEELKAEAVAS